MTKTIISKKVIAFIIAVCALITLLPATFVEAAQTPVLTSFSRDNEFLSAKEAVSGSSEEYSTADRTLTTEKAVWVFAEAFNPYSQAPVTNARIRFTISQTNANTVDITATVTSSNAAPFTDSIRFTDDEPFHMEYEKNYTYLYYYPDGDYRSYEKSDEDAVSDTGALIGSSAQDGVISGKSAAGVLIELNVVRDSDFLPSKYKGRQKATATMWNLVQNYCEPSYFTTKYYDRMRKQQYLDKKGSKEYKKLASIAKKKTKGCTSDYDKSLAICKLVADRVYYDYPYYKGKVSFTNENPYQVWKQRKSVCRGYARLYYEMLTSINIPCMMVFSHSHEYNAVYDKDSGKWMFVDVTGYSGKDYTVDHKWIDKGINEYGFDIRFPLMLSTPTYNIYNICGVKIGGVFYDMDVSKPGSDDHTKGYKKMSEWRWKVTYRKKGAKVANKIAGIKVKH